MNRYLQQVLNKIDLHNILYSNVSDNLARKFKLTVASFCVFLNLNEAHLLLVVFGNKIRVFCKEDIRKKHLIPANLLHALLTLFA